MVTMVTMVTMVAIVVVIVVVIASSSSKVNPVVKHPFPFAPVIPFQSIINY